MLLELLSAVRVMHVTRERMPDPAQAEGLERIRRVAEAIRTLEEILPEHIAQASRYLASVRPGQTPYLGADHLKALIELRGATERASGMYRAERQPHRAQPWHSAALLVDWHVGRILEHLGRGQRGTAENGPLVRLISSVLDCVRRAKAKSDAVGESTRSGAAVSKAIERHRL